MVEVRFSFPLSRPNTDSVQLDSQVPARACERILREVGTYTRRTVTKSFDLRLDWRDGDRAFSASIWS